ncbi:histidine phosphatase family protein [Candidatus Woesearchaeota archaeon]|jgi:phosphoserine phosphatase|nr:histidine phosphatase family protein [Candidatus Woesearchaeota archaeon]
MKLIIVRHGETKDNIEGITQGQSDSQLTQKGIDQAKKVAISLKDEKLDFAYSSDLSRTMNTAKEIIQFHQNLALIKNSELREQNKGVYERLPRYVINEAVESVGLPYYKFRPLDGESVLEVNDRIKKFLEELKSKHDKETILVVGHGVPIACMLVNLLNEKIVNFAKFLPIENTGIFVININGMGIGDLIKQNCSKHLITSPIYNP